jgi:hypothetical protein
MSSKNSSTSSKTSISSTSNSSSSPKIAIESAPEKKTLEELEKIVNNPSYTVFDGDCVRKKSNWSKSGNEYKFDTSEFNPDKLLNDMKMRSPKLNELMRNISKLDAQDMKKYNKQFKHFIFSDLKSSSNGAKLLASAFISKGMKLGYTASLKTRTVEQPVANEEEKNKEVPQNISPVFPQAPPPSPATGSIASAIGSFFTPTPASEPQPEEVVEELQQPEVVEEETEEEEPEEVVEEEESEEPEEEEEIESQKTGGEPKKKKYNKITLLSDEELLQNKGNNFYLLSSVGVYEQPISVVMKKSILKKFNQRPDNVYGELARFIIMDSGFKEGIDLFDIKYIHIFEPQTTGADQKQVIGRGTRTCGQKGLVFNPTRGWPLYVFNYDLSIGEEYQKSFNESKTAIELYLKAMNIDLRLLNFANDLERVAIFGSVDYELNKNIHTFSIGNETMSPVDETESESIGGGPKVMKIKKRLLIRDDLPKIVIPSRPGNPIQQVLDMQQSQLDNSMNHDNMRKYIRENFSDYSWDNVKMENLCGYAGPEQKGGADLIKYSPTQDFIRNYFTPQNPLKGMLLWNSVGTGKTCSAIAAATSSFEPQGYTILWVTRTTLKNDIWKNMFEQVCHERIRIAISEGAVVPEEQSKRMKMLSKSWSIRPMSYKQFSNLVSKQNNFYKDLVKKNGEADPLNKTLLIIDEAHKLYGGTDLSSIERPDMNALHKALMNSYLVSGINSVKLLLMTATPITNNPMELIKLLNLCRMPNEQISDDFTSFSEKYLNEDGKFTAGGEREFLDDIAGYISYLNREKDARQFSQPIIKQVQVPLVNQKTKEQIENYDKKQVREFFEGDVIKLKEKINAANEKLQGELSDLDKSKFLFLKDKCNEYDGKAAKTCNKIVNKNIGELLKEARNATKEIRKEIKVIREEIKNANLFKKEKAGQIKENLEKNPEEFEKYKDTLFYNLKTKCTKKVKDESLLIKSIEKHPSIVKVNSEISEFDNRIKVLQDNFKLNLVAYKNRIKEIKNLMKSNLSDLEKGVLKMTIVDQQKSFRKTNKLDKKIMVGEIKDLKKTKKAYEKEKKKFIVKIRKTMKKQIKSEKKVEKANKRAEIKLKRTLRKQGELREDINDEMLKTLILKYSKLIEDDISKVSSELAAMEREKEEKLAEKAAKKEEKAAEKAVKAEETRKRKEAKAIETEQKKQLKKAAAEEARATKKLRKDMEKAEKAAAKIEKAANATRKKK